MNNGPMSTKSTVIPCLRYRNAHAAIDWLGKAFGFEKHAAYENPEGQIMHAELTLGSGMIMLGSVIDGDYGKVMIHPDETGLRNTQSISVTVKDADEVYRLAKAQGAPMIFDIEDKPYGGRGFTCRDLEGHIWSFGTYDPWEKPQS
jgi:uncharacterized glyoxalase superfamily protein PhnB